MIKASSMAYAIFIFIIIGICCYAFILLSSVSLLHDKVLATQREIIFTSEDAKRYFLDNIENLENPISIDVIDNDLISEGSVSSWGVFNILKTKTIFKEDTLQRVFMIGQRNRKRPSIYLANNGKTLRLTGEASIKGNIFVPEGKLETGYIGSNSYKKLNFKGGVINRSEIRLPNIDLKPFEEEQSLNLISIDTLPPGSEIYNEFENKTLQLYSEKKMISNITLKGNIMLVIKDSVIINPSCKFEDIIITGSKITFSSGFKGSMQVFATESVKLESKVMLTYPSALFLKNNDDKDIKVHLDRGSQIVGGIVIEDKEYVGNTTRMLILESGSRVIGDIYCNGSVDLKGKIIGSLYADRFYLKTAAGTHENYIKDGQVSNIELPYNFIGLSLFKSDVDKNYSYEVLKNL